MGLNVSASMGSGFQFENKENLRNAAKNILSRKGNTEQSIQKITENAFIETELKESYLNPQLSIIKASTQISLNESLKETLKYLKSHAAQSKSKEPQLGELWELFTATKIENPNNELFSYEIDSNITNIFAA